MPKYPKEEEKINYIREFVYLTWEAVRRNPDYRGDYRRFLENHGLTPDDVRPKKNPDGSIQIPFHPAFQGARGYFAPKEGRFVLEEEAPDPNKCNLSYMLDRWGFACDPDDPIPQRSWASFLHMLSKEWRRSLQRSSQKPDVHFSLSFKKLPGVLEVERFPKVYLNDPDPDGVMREAIVQSRGAINHDLLPWVVENPANLTITINLHAPSQLIRHSLELLIELCKKELVILDDKIDSDMINKYLAAWDLKQQGKSDEHISKEIPLRKYEIREEQRGSPEMAEGDHEIDSDTYYKFRRIKDYVEKAEMMIHRGSLI
jgi:hypothetical protein